MINVSSDIVNSINVSVSSAFQSFLPIFGILLSLPIAFFVIREILFLLSLVKR